MFHRTAKRDKFARIKACGSFPVQNSFGGPIFKNLGQRVIEVVIYLDFHQPYILQLFFMVYTN